MPNKVTYTFVVADRFSAAAARMKARAASLKAKIRGVGQEAKETSRRLRDMGQSLATAGAKMSVLSAAVLAAGGFALVQSSKFEQLGVAFEVMTGSAEKGRRVLSDLTRFAAATPFQLANIAESAKVLLAFGVESENVTDILRRLGDMAAGTGKPLSEFALIFGKIKAKGKITGEELQQLAEKGVNLREALGRKFNLNALQVEKAISQGAVSFEAVRDVIVEMTSKGGRFFELTSKQSKTLGGLWSTLKDNIALAGKEIGDALVEVLDLKGVLVAVTSAIGRFTAGFARFAKERPGLVKFGLAMAAAVVAIGPLLVAAAGAAFVLSNLAAGAAVLGVSLGALLLTIGGIGAAFGLLVAAGALLIANWKKIKLSFQFLAEDIASAVAGIAGSVNDFLGGAPGKVLKFLFGGDVTQNSRADVNVNLVAPKGTVESVKTRTTGSASGLNVGVNMAEAL